ncbi:MAG: amidohydrolase [Acidothermales bacterium]|jgi:predicted amidohydrolase|nr:amidohydrolase [Acidothermales bacterium]MDQ3423967.1 amidohydrolase [Actinomycetota bacterium]
MRITLAQVDSRLGDIDANFELAHDTVASAVEESADLVVFPELFLSGYSVGEVDADLSIRPDDPRIEKLARRAGGTGLLVGFMESGPHGPHTYNSTVYYEGDRLVHVHRKLYLPAYAPFEERDHFSPGQTLRAFPVRPANRMAVLLCNDAWQPQLAFLATQDGAQVLLVPAASAQSIFPDRYDSREYWHDITRFYGRMFQLFVVFVNRVGSEGSLRFWGGSHIVDPWGNLVGEAAREQEQLLTVDLDMAEIRRRRRQVPLVKEARLGLLEREIGRLLEEGGDL